MRFSSEMTDDASDCGFVASRSSRRVLVSVSRLVTRVFTAGCNSS